MDELLTKLLESEVLSEDTVKSLKEAIESKIQEASEAAKETVTADVTAQLTEQWVKERDELVEAIDSKVTEFLANEFDELKEDIERFRDLEAEYAEKLVESKAAMSDELQGDLSELVEKLDAFLEIRLSEEMDELREDLDEVRKNDFGRKVFEAFAEEFVSGYADEDSAENTLREMEIRLAETEEALAEAEAERAELIREAKMDEILSSLSGRQKDVMEAILKNVDTNKLEEGYKTFIGRVIRETEDSEKEGKVLAENDSEDDKDDDKDSKKKPFKKKGEKDEDDDDDDDDKEDIKEGRAVTGDTEEMINEGANSDPELAQRLAHLRKLAGI